MSGSVWLPVLVKSIGYHPRSDRIRMQNASYDTDLAMQVIAPLRRIINKDGQFNVHRRGTRI